MNTFPYRDVFLAVERRLVELGSICLPVNEIHEYLNAFKTYKNRELSDDQYFLILVFVIFYSGFKAQTVTARREIIEGYFSSWERVAGYNSQDIKAIICDEQMIRNERKVRACVTNAKKFGELISAHGSLKKFIGTYSPEESLENLLRLKKFLQSSFSYLGQITTYHFMTDIGFPVLKPDRVICRIFTRLGLLDSEKQLIEAISHGKRFAEETGYPIRYIDIVFVAYGQASFQEIGLVKGVCLKDPRCDVCGIRKYCQY